MKIFKKLKLNKVLFFVFIFLLTSNVSFAATLMLSPQTGTYSNGSTITVNIIVSSADKTMNAASGVISFPTDLLTVSSISKNSSIVGFWAQEPSFSNTNGTISFEGVVLPPWYTGSSGRILTVVFKAKAPGTADISFTSGSILAADGIGTDITTGKTGGVYEISSSKQTQPITITPEDSGVPQAPEVVSSTHPDQTKWYSLSDASFSWPLSKDIIGSSVIINKISKSLPTVLYDPPISSKDIKDIEDGVWYFHAQLKNSNGWSAATHFKIQVDTTKPSSFDITEVIRKDQTDPNVKFVFKAIDKTSGIDHYEVQIDNSTPEDWIDDGSHIYTTKSQEGGSHTLLAKAVDRAGNYLANSTSFAVVALEAPTITDYPTEIDSGEILAVSGNTKYSEVQAVLFLKDENGKTRSYSAKADKNGNFTIVSNDRLKDGLYSAWVQVVDARGARSLSSDVVTISIKKSALFRIGSWAVSFLAVFIPLLALLLLLLILLWYAWYRWFILGKKLKKEVREAEDALHKAFDLLKESVQDQVKILEKVKNKRQLTVEEEKINKQLKKDLEDAESYIKKEIEDIEDIIDPHKGK